MFDGLLGVDVLLFLAIGVLGGTHCIGMCGPLVTIYSERMNPRPDGGTAGATGRGRGGRLTLYETRQHALFNVGRAASYTLLGAAFGAPGGLVFVTTGPIGSP